MKRLTVGLAALLGLAVGADLAYGSVDGGWVELGFTTELQSLNLTGGPFLVPLASDPANLLSDPDSVYGWGFVNSQVALTLSSQRSPVPGPASTGYALAFSAQEQFELADGGVGENGPPPIDPADWHGQEFGVDSFFDVFFDIRLEDVDGRPGRDFAGQGDGGLIQVEDVGPASMWSNYTATFDKDAPNFGLIPPPEVAPYKGHFDIEIPLRFDINQNGENDKLKFTLATHSVGDDNRTWIELPDGTIVDTFDSEAMLEGAIVDESDDDPPFTIGTLANPLTGPTTAGSNLQNPVIPEPASLALLGMGAVFLLVCAWRKRRRR